MLKTITHTQTTSIQYNSQVNLGLRIRTMVFQKNAQTTADCNPSNKKSLEIPTTVIINQDVEVPSVSDLAISHHEHF